MSELQRLFKQIFYAVLYFMIWSSVVYGAYLTVFPYIPSCFDSKQNQDELGIDCGGVCKRTCPPPFPPPGAEELKILATKVIPNGTNTYDLIAQIKNPNSIWGINSLEYQFIIYQGDNPIKTISEKSYLLPSQTKYIIQPLVATDVSANRVEVKIIPLEWQKIEENFKFPQFIIEDKKYQEISNGVGFAEASGILVNKSFFGFEKIDVNILLFDENDQILAVNYLPLHTMKIDEARFFNSIWYNPFAGKVKKILMEADTNVFDQTNYLKVTPIERELP